MNNTHSSHTPDPVRERIMNMIKKGDAHMKPRWHFVVISVLFALGVLCTFLVLLYAASLSVFLLHESGVWFAPSFGVRGWLVFARSIPLFQIAFIFLFIFILEAMIRRYALVYRQPLIGSFIFVAALIFLGGIVIGQTPFHRQIASFARGHQLPPPLNIPYGPAMRIARPPDLYEGTVVAKENGALVIEHVSDGDSDADDGHTSAVMSAYAQLSTTSKRVHVTEDEHSVSHGKKRTRVLITPHTRLPRRQDFEVGSSVMVEGDRVGTDTIDAFGVRDIDD